VLLVSHFLGFSPLLFHSKKIGKPCSLLFLSYVAVMLGGVRRRVQMDLNRVAGKDMEWKKVVGVRT
jgi:hypothetical protein